jgi:hypothetical protein
MRCIDRFDRALPLLAALVLVVGARINEARGQQAGNPPGGNVAGNQAAGNVPFVGGMLPGGQPGLVGGNGAPGNPGGAASADFDSLIDLITSTVESDSWIDNGTGEGDIQPFPNGVYVDAAGALRFRQPREGLAAARARGLPARTGAAAAPPSANGSPTSVAEGARPVDAARTSSPLRFVSLSKLEAAIANCQRRHAPLEPAMLSLAGLQKVQYIFVYPESGDLVLAGPAGDWSIASHGAIVSLESGRPVVRLDDLLALWRRQRAEKSTAFGCSIVPRQEALARTQEFLNASAAAPIEPGDRRDWLEELRSTLGVQDVEYYNIDDQSRIAALLLAADYHMKLIGMGLAEGVPGVKSYLATVRNGADGSPPPMAVLRWWFAMPESTVETSDAHDAYALPTNCVCVLSENEMLAARGERVHTGQSDALNRQFAESFTAAFDQLALKYPVYGELERVFELALALAVVEREGLAEKAGWTPSLLLDEQRLRLPRTPAPQEVETVINHRVVGGRQIIAGVSGGVWVDGGKGVQITTGKTTASGNLAKVRKAPMQQDREANDVVWWWD